MASNQSEDNKVSSAFPTPDHQCERFASTEGDVVVFRSIDHVLYNIHRVNLRVNTTGPFAEDFPAPKGDVADLTEDAETLELLFSFVYAKQHQTLSNLPFDKQLRLAEAAEKYGVVPAKTVCRLLFEYIYKDHPLEILVFAYTHDYEELLDACAPRVIGMPIEKVYAVIPPSLFNAWALYSDQWLPTILRVIRRVDFRMYHQCDAAQNLSATAQNEAAERHEAPYYESDAFFDELSRSGTCYNGNHTGELRMLIQDWTSSLRTRIASLPSLSSFLWDALFLKST